MPTAPDSERTEHGEIAEAPLLRGEVAFRLLVEAVADYAIFLLGPDGRVLTWNLGAQRIKGYTAEEVIGQHFSIFYTPEEREAGRPMSILGWAAEYGRFEDEGWRVRKDGSRFWADVILTALRDESGEPYAYAKITRDLTERRAAEEQQILLIAEQRARQTAEEALAARDRFLGIAAHELKTPVASLQLATESLIRAKSAGRLDPKRLDTGLSRMVRASQRLGTLVGELLDVARLTAEPRPYETAPTDLVALTRDVIAQFDEVSGGRVSLRAPAEVWVVADAARLDQVVTNLIDNALKYSAPPSSIEVEISEGADGARLIVRDEGIGLDDAVGRIWEAFGRGLNAEHVPGMGLGLFISQQIAARHGGRIEAAPREDRDGSVFTLSLPHRDSAELDGPV
ncbi:MAG: PAS domain-containing sensor histidine kinase [Chloroflexota bacterium]|nr:PAS domain-containing sensor histidine kinase [Chloroflexota bacterium]